MKVFYIVFMILLISCNGTENQNLPIYDTDSLSKKNVYNDSVPVVIKDTSKHIQEKPDIYNTKIEFEPKKTLSNVNKDSLNIRELPLPGGVPRHKKVDSLKGLRK